MSSIEFITLGIISGLSPGPVMALMFGETFRHGGRRALGVPLALFVSNLFITPAMLLVLIMGNTIDGFIQIIPYFGALILIFMGIQEWRASPRFETQVSTRPFIKSFLIDLVSPFGYLIWLTVLGPTMLAFFQTQQYSEMVLFWVLFIGSAVMTLCCLIATAHQIKPFMKSHQVVFVLRFMALLLIFFGLKLLIS
ncbi:MAG: LysE family transporter [Candidatus Gracilibacteria bacterium]|nr:LysE family transporter [Candidatus Gracilibacteria bacterium]